MTPERAEEVARNSTRVIGLRDDQLFAVTQAILQACAEQRETDAKICEDISGNEPSGASGRFGALDCAAAIREGK